MIQDAGWQDDYNGWYDVRGCGSCQDYCRWEGNGGSGGDPSIKTVHVNGLLTSSWACQTPKSTNINFKIEGAFHHKKCTIFRNGVWQLPTPSLDKGMLQDILRFNN